MIHRPHELDKFFIDDADDLLAGVEGAQHFLADRPLGDTLDEVVGDSKVNVSFEQGAADLAQPVPDVRLREPSPAAKFLERFAQTALDAFKHSELEIIENWGISCNGREL